MVSVYYYKHYYLVCAKHYTGSFTVIFARFGTRGRIKCLMHAIKSLLLSVNQKRFAQKGNNVHYLKKKIT